MIHKKTITGVAFLLLGLGGLYAQETVPATGGDAIGTGGSSSYTLGQVVYTNNPGSNGSIKQGVQQPYEISITLGVDVTEINLELLAYPNPTNNALTLNIGNYNNEKLTYQLYNIQGELLASKQITNRNTIISMQDLPMSTYVLSVLVNNLSIKTFRIIKK